MLTSTSSVPVLPEHLHLDVKNGVAGYKVWLQALFNTFVRCGAALTAFKTKISQAPTPPQLDDLRPQRESTTSQPPATINPFDAPPGNTNRHLFSTPAESPVIHQTVDPSASPRASGPSYRYARDSDGTTTAEGLTKFDADMDTYDDRAEKFRALASFTFSAIFDTLKDSTKTTLYIMASWEAIRDSVDLIGLRTLLDSIFTTNTTAYSTASIKNLTSLQQTDSTSVVDYLRDFRLLMETVHATFASKTSPKDLDMNAIGVSVLLAGISSSRSAFVESYSALHTSIDTLTPESVAAAFQQWETDRNNIRASQGATITDTISTVNIGAFTSAVTPASGTRAQAPRFEPTLHTTSYPFSRARGDPLRKGPGNPTKPHCGHCGLIDIIMNNHTTDDCNDLTLYRHKLGNPSAVFAFPVTPATPTPATNPATPPTPSAQAAALQAHLSFTPDPFLAAFAAEAGGEIDTTDWS